MNSRPQPYQGCALPLSYGSTASGVAPGRSAPRAEGARVVKRGKAGLDEVMTKDEKAERLAAALRDNLRRRKAQAREAVPPSPAPDEDR